ncbi:MAG: peptide-methionine (S)-S-oxide reductase MsrA [Acidobacteriota bacterium]
MTEKSNIAMFGAGCFWGVEETFRAVSGVTATAVGYAGGTLMSPSYHDVCTDRTGHAEVVQLEFDPERVTYETLLDVFWENHDPTTKDRQGPDYGSQYRSVIFFYTPEQEASARKSVGKAQAKLRRPIVTEISPAPTFWRAEEYHQQYLAKRGMSRCHVHGAARSPLPAVGRG